MEYQAAPAKENRDPEAPLEQLLSNVRSSADELIDGAKQFDELTGLCLEYRGNPDVREKKTDGEEMNTTQTEELK